jgi:PAS domain-containing protein
MPKALSAQVPKASGLSVVPQSSSPEPPFSDFGQLTAEFARSFVDSSPDCIKVLDLDGRLLSMNPGGCRQMEMDDFATCAFSTWTDLWPEPAKSAAVDAVNAARAGQASRFHGFCPTAKGNARWWDVLVTPSKTQRASL